MKKRILFASTSLLMIFSNVYAQGSLPFQPIDSVSKYNVISNRQKSTEKRTEQNYNNEKINEETSKENPEETESKKVMIKTIVVEGITSLPGDDVKAIISKYEGKELYLSQMQEIAALITNAYRQKGDIKSKAYLPLQTIEGGVLTIKVIEGSASAAEIK